LLSIGHSLLQMKQPNNQKHRTRQNEYGCSAAGRRGSRVTRAALTIRPAAFFFNMDAMSGFGVLSSSLNHGCFGIERAGAIGLRRVYGREIELWKPC
jgi:hypothetical protein